MKNVENKEYHALLGLTKQERNDIIIRKKTTQSFATVLESNMLAMSNRFQP